MVCWFENATLVSYAQFSINPLICGAPKAIIRQKMNKETAKEISLFGTKIKLEKKTFSP